ncbi:MAG: hypothetical protein NTW25_00005, partial [Candidatus Kapabacteria bacterium]|nr:hypothetical protein [Candidatus Kapabacteria bacterium]
CIHMLDFKQPIIFIVMIFSLFYMFSELSDDIKRVQEQLSSIKDESRVFNEEMIEKITNLEYQLDDIEEQRYR